jgi:hypothetical protein
MSVDAATRPPSTRTNSAVRQEPPTSFNLKAGKPGIPASNGNSNTHRRPPLRIKTSPSKSDQPKSPPPDGVSIFSRRVPQGVVPANQQNSVVHGLIEAAQTGNRAMFLHYMAGLLALPADERVAIFNSLFEGHHRLFGFTTGNGVIDTLYGFASKQKNPHEANVMSRALLYYGAEQASWL